MDDARRKILYAQLRLILMELLWSRPQPKKRIVDDSILTIHASETVGTKEKMV